MPPLPLASALLRSLPWLSARGRAAINFLVCDNGRATSAESLASNLGLRSRYQLARLLRREGLPPYDILTGWILLLYWVVEAERDSVSLLALARRSQVPPATSYRLVRRIAGTRWTDLKQASTAEVLRRFVEQCLPQRVARPRAERPAVRTVAHRPAPADVAPSVPRDSGPGVRLTLGGAPEVVVVHDGHEAYVARARAASIERVDATTGQILGTIPVGCVPSCLSIDTVRQRVYVSIQYEDAIAVIDQTSHRVVGTIPVPGDPFPVLLDCTGKRLFVTTNEDCLYALALPAGRIVEALPLPATSHFLTLHPAGHRVYVATRAGGTVLEVDTSTLQVHRTFELGGEPLDLRVSTDGRFLYVANGRQGLNVVRLVDGRLVRTIPLEGRPLYLALAPDERRMYVSLVEGGAIASVDAASWEVSFVTTGGRPRGLAVGQHGKRLIVCNESGWVDLIPL